MIDRTIGFIGAGNMAEAMIRGLLRGNDFTPAQISASGPREERMRELRETYGIIATTDNTVPATAQIVVLSVKPQILSRVLDEVADAIGADTLVISIAAGVPVATIQSTNPALIRGTIAEQPKPAGVSAPARLKPTVTSASSIFWVNNSQASRSRAEF